MGDGRSLSLPCELGQALVRYLANPVEAKGEVEVWLDEREIDRAEQNRSPVFKSLFEWLKALHGKVRILHRPVDERNPPIPELPSVLR
jgi:hypothetical protein